VLIEFTDILEEGDYIMTYPICVHCKQPVKVNIDRYEVFENMHWICFHYVFEHDVYDPDEPCDDPSCPTLALKEKFSSHG
jgi:hypothetical protein